MNPDHYPSHRGSMQGYSSEYAQYSPRDRRASSSAIQVQQLGWQPQLYGLQSGDQDVANQYEYNPGVDWANNFDLAPPSLPESVATGDFDLGVIQQITSSQHEEPWNSARQHHSLRPQTSPQFYTPNINIPKAHTVAAQPRYQSFNKPPFKPHPSFTLSVDSGFVSGPTLSEKLPNAPELDLNSISRVRSGYQSTINESEGPAESVRSDPHPQGIHAGTKRKRSKAPVSPCNICRKDLKNQSDAHKHEKQHTKPHFCTHPECTRAQQGKGFATPNDLERHRKSVHQEEPRVGKRDGYICTACPTPSPGTIHKWWPRLDNFKAHIGRKHKECNMEQLVKSSQRPKPVGVNADQAYASQQALSHPSEDQHYQQDMSSPIARGMSRHASQQGDFTNHFDFHHGGRSDQLVGVGAGADQVTGGRQSDPRLHWPRRNPGNGLVVLRDAALQQSSSPMDAMTNSPVYARLSVPEVQITGSTWAEGYQQQFGQLALEDRSPKRCKLARSSDVQEVAVYGQANGEHVCPECGKAKKRECDLRKHMKRHTRPYGCTFPSCIKRFGSRNDWKRHENSQHHLQEMWRCERERQDGTKCGRLFYHEETFAHHLERKHGILMKTDESVTNCTSMHLGREGHHHFWCGFCNTLIEQSDNGQQGAWDFRFKHIGDHFDKGNWHIEDWIDIEENRRKGRITERNRKKKKLRFNNGRFDDDSDLGEDGIPAFASGYNTAPVSNGPVRRSMVTDSHTTSKRRMDVGDADADAVTDDYDDWKA